jgi:hypothetical protein
MSQRVVFIGVELEILLKSVIRRRVIRLGINLENIQVIMERNIQITTSDCLFLVMILMNPQILIHKILDCLCQIMFSLLKQMILMLGFWIPENQYIWNVVICGILILNKHRMEPTYILEMIVLIRSRDTKKFQ